MFQKEKPFENSPESSNGSIRSVRALDSTVHPNKTLEQDFQLPPPPLSSVWLQNLDRLLWTL